MTQKQKNLVGGISILGTSGIVHPYSNAAYGATIQVQLRSIGASGGRAAALVTGGRTAAAAFQVANRPRQKPG